MSEQRRMDRYELWRVISPLSQSLRLHLDSGYSFDGLGGEQATALVDVLQAGLLVPTWFTLAQASEVVGEEIAQDKWHEFRDWLCHEVDVADAETQLRNWWKEFNRDDKDEGDEE